MHSGSFFVARKETKRQRSWHLVSLEHNMSCIYDAGYSPEYCEAIIIRGVPEEKIMSAKHG